MRPKQVEDHIPPPGWYVLKCPPQKEVALEMRLQRGGLTSIAPREIYWVRPTSKQKRERPHVRWLPRERPMFPRMVFAHIARPSDWDAVRYATVSPCDRDADRTTVRMAPFLVGVLTLAGRPYRLSDSDVNILYNVDKMQQSQPIEPKQLKAGDKAKVSIGALAGHACEIQAVAGKRAKVLLMLLGSMKTVDIPITSLEAV